MFSFQKETFKQNFLKNFLKIQITSIWRKTFLATILLFAETFYKDDLHLKFHSLFQVLNFFIFNPQKLFVWSPTSDEIRLKNHLLQCFFFLMQFFLHERVGTTRGGFLLLSKKFFYQLSFIFPQSPEFQFNFKQKFISFLRMSFITSQKKSSFVSTKRKAR